MRQILVTIMLLMTVVLLYTQIVSGPGGTKASIRSGAEGMAESISRISP